MSLSVVCPTRDPGARVAALLAPFRDVADEIVICADARVADAQLRHYAGVADRLVRFEHPGSGRAQGWVAEQCRGDWIMLIAGDEVASPALIEQLPDLVGSRDALQYWFPMRWLYPDAGHWLDELPWAPDFHNRLTRNDGTLRYPGTMHSSAFPARPARYVDLPMYHLDCILTTEAMREAKAQMYEGIASLRAPGGGALNLRYYLPERYATRAPAAVPQRDRAAIDAVLAPRQPVPRPLPRGAPPAVSNGEVLRRWAGRTPSEDAYRATIEPLEHDHRMEAGEHRAVHVRVTNGGCETWHWAAPEQAPSIRVAYRWCLPDGTIVEAEGHRTAFPCSVAPGETCIVPAVVTAPASSGVYLLEFDVLHDDVRWFGCETRIEMTVHPVSVDQAETSSEVSAP